MQNSSATGIPCWVDALRLGQGGAVGERETVEAGSAHIRADQNPLSSAIIVAVAQLAKRNVWNVVPQRRGGDGEGDTAAKRKPGV